MNIEYLRTWKYVPRVLVGAIFSVELYILFRGTNSDDDLATIFDYAKSLGGNPLSVVLFVLLIMILVALGNKLLFGLTHYIGFAFNPIVKRIFSNVVELTMDETQLAIYYIKQNSNYILEYYALKSLSQPELTNKYDESKNTVNEHANRIFKHIDSTDNYELARLLSYYSGVTQEQALEDHLSKDIYTIKYSIIIVLIIPFILKVLNIASSITFWTFLIIAIAWLFISIPFLVSLKRKYAYFLINSLLDPFTIGELAETEDREAY